MRNLQWDEIKAYLFSPKVVLIICLALLFYSFVFQKPGVVRQIQLLHENKKLKQDISLMQDRVKLLQDKVDKLENDLDTLKAEAVKHGYAEPDEVIVKVPVP